MSINLPRFLATGSVSLEKQCRTIFVENIPIKYTSIEALWQVFENQRCGGGEIDKIDYEEGRETALITFKDSSGA